MKALVLVFFTFAVVTAQAHDEASRIETTANPGVWKFTWLGKSGRTYFVQNSQDLQSWATLPLIEVGTDERIEYGFTTDAPRFFFRLRFSDLPAGDVLTADFDGDGVSNWDEIQQGLDPFKADTDGDGMSDGYELAYGLNPLLADGAGDLDADGLTNAAEFAAGTSPTNPDTDGDGLNDSREIAAGRNATAKDESVHALIDFPIGLTPQAINNKGTVLFTGTVDGYPVFYRWTAGVLEPLELPPLAENQEFGNFNSPTLNSQGGVAVNLERNNNLSILIWLPGSTAYIELANSPIYLVEREYEDPHYEKSAQLAGFNAQNHVWAYVHYRQSRSELAKWDSHSGSPVYLGEKHFVGPSVTALGNNDSGTLISYKLDPDGAGSHYVGSIPVPFWTKAINSAGWVLGWQNNSNGTNNSLLYKNFVTINLPDWNLTGLDDDNNLYGLTSGNRKVMWTKDKNTFVSDPISTNIYEPVEYVPVIMPEGWTSTHQVIHGSLAPQLGVGQFTNPAVPGAVAQTKPFLLIPAEISVDNNRDGKIKLRREHYIATEDDTTSALSPFRFWSNDDDDQGPAAGDDIPGRALNKADYNNVVVDSVRDLVDFFPVYLDIKQLLTVLPPSASIKYKLKQADGALNFVYTNLTNQYLPAEKRSKAFDYQYKVLGTGFGPDFTQAAGVATTQQITAAGVELNTAFLDGIKNTDWGVLLIEGRVASDQPLKLVVEKDGTQIAEVAVNIKISPVEEMFRHVNLTGTPKNYDNTNPSLPETPEATRTAAPLNYPDNLTNGKYFVFLHGYNVDAQKARGWQAEVFKRLHALGSKARFVGVTWHGATGLDYHKAVFHAFQTGDALAGALGFTGNADVTVAAHSLGNMVVSHAIQAGGFTPARYYIINGATPLEAYDPTDAGPGEAANMTELAWRNYDARLYMANWHTLFDAADNRRRLTWKSLFKDVGPKAHNFYSEEEEVVADADLNTSASVVATLLNQGFNVSFGAWKAQELVKGVDWTTSIVSAFMIRGQAGWGFNTDWDILDDPTGPPGQGGTPIRRRRTPAQTVAITGEELKTKPFFEEFLESELMSANATTASNKAGEAWVRYDLFARAIPAMSNATAANVMASLTNARNFPMHTAGKVAANGPFPTTPDEAWRHSDFKDVGLPYVYPMYQAMIDRGRLNQ